MYESLEQWRAVDDYLLGIHGLDLATALGHQPWLTTTAAQVLTGLLLDGHDSRAMNDLGWDELTFLRKATGRHPLTAEETRYVQQRGVRWPALG